MISANNACDYIVTMLDEAGEELNLLKLQKLLYYAQAWYLAFYKKPLFSDKFQAWIHGPVCRPIYNRFSSTKSLYSNLSLSDRCDDFNLGKIPVAIRRHLDGVLEVYVKFSGSQLEDMTHSEDPWKIARKGYRTSERCEVELDEALMCTYYGARLTKNG